MQISIACSLLIAAQLVAIPQSSSTIPGVEEPPELTGEPKTLPTPSDTVRQFGLLMNKWRENEPETINALRPELDEFIKQHPDYADAYTIRAMGDLCYLKSTDYQSIEGDINQAISAQSSHKSLVAFDLAFLDSIRGKLKYEVGRYPEAMDDLDAAIKQNTDSADKTFNVQGVEPEIKSRPCSWSKTDLDGLVQRFPKDYRVYIYEGLYLAYFTTLKETYYPQALQQFQKAVALNPRSALPHYFMGHLYTQSSFWTKAAWASDAAKNEALQKAAQEYTRAIELNPAFLPAYEQRSSAYLNLKQSRQAIKDYDKVLEVDPENATAYHDRGLAKMDLGDYFSATLDLSDFIHRRQSDAQGLAMAYENLGEAHMKLGDYNKAVSDFSEAIKQRLANDSFLMNIHQFRAIYPEYKQVSNEAFCRKIQGLFWPEYTYEVMSKRLMEENKDFSSFLLADLYVKRGDAYVKANQLRKAITEYRRAFDGYDKYGEAIDRWRLVASSSVGQYYLDVKTVEFSTDGSAKFWLKTLGKESTYPVDAYEIHCQSHD